MVDSSSINFPPSPLPLLFDYTNLVRFSSPEPRSFWAALRIEGNAGSRKEVGTVPKPELS